jgi:phosphohistidine phosphatase SixA
MKTTPVSVSFSNMPALFLVLILLAAGCRSGTAIYVVRHAEKAAPSGDVPLSGDGLQRAEDLKNVLQDKNISAVYSTAFERTKQTAWPMAQLINKPVEFYNNGDSLLKVLTRRKGKNFLVVGHSYTVPQIIRSIGLQPGFEGDIPDNQYDNLFKITVSKKETSVVVTKYGVRSE